MLQDMRQNIQGTMAKIIVGLIVVAFSLFGIESILLGGGGGGVAEVNGEDISPQEMQQAVNNQKRRLIAMMGDNIDPALLDDQRISGQVMESLIQRKLLTQSASGLGLTISESQIGIVVSAMEQFQIDGQFSADAYRSVLSNAGYTPASFKQGLQEDMLLTQLRSGLAGSEFATAGELALGARIVSEQRDVRYLTIPLEKFMTEAEVSDGEIASFYEANSDAFRTQEAVELDYIELRPEDFLQPVEESAILEVYELEVQGGQYSTEHRVSHVLFEQGADETAEALQARVASAQAKLAEGVTFADVAGEYSDDIGSSATGGDLGFTSGDTFPEAMETTIAELEVNVVSEPVQTEAGIHLILVTERREGEAPSLEEMRPQLQQSIAMEEARVTLLRTVESLKDLAFNAEDLQGPAEELQLQVSQSERVSRDQADGLFAHPGLLGAAFSEDVLQAGHNSDVIELGNESFVVLRVRQYIPSEVKPLEDVRGEIVARISEDRARAEVMAQAERALAALRSGTSVEEFATAGGYEWQVELGAQRGSLNVPPEVLQRCFTLPLPGEGASVSDYVTSASGDALVLQLGRVSAGELQALSAPERQALQQQVGGEYAQLINTEYQQELRDSAEITVL